MVLSDGKKSVMVYLLVVVILVGAGFLLGRTTGNGNNDDQRVQRIMDGVARIENIYSTLESGLKRIEQATVAGQAGTEKVIGGIGTAIGLMEDSAERERSRSRNNQAAQERVEFLENKFREIYQREQAKTK